MTPDEARAQAVRHWVSLAQEALESADMEQAAGHHGFALNRAYYACFYAACAVLLREGRTFKRHSGVRTALHEHLIKTRRIEPALGDFYDRLFDQRMEADCVPFSLPNKDMAAGIIEQAKAFVKAMRDLAGKASP